MSIIEKIIENTIPDKGTGETYEVVWADWIDAIDRIDDLIVAARAGGMVTVSVEDLCLVNDAAQVVLNLIEESGVTHLFDEGSLQ